MDRKRSWSCDQAVTSSPDPPKRQKTLRYDPNQYTIAWICALHIEMAAARAMLDEIHEDLPQDANDKNTYMLGSIGRHNIVIACLPNGHYGTNNAASVLTNMLRSFTSIHNGFMVGIGGGVPSRADIRLGDVVVGTRVMQYDLCKLVDGDIQRTAHAKTPHYSLQTAVSNLRSKHELGPSRVPTILQETAAKYPEYGHPASPDRLFLSTYKHDPRFSSCCACDQSKVLPKSARSPNHPKIHHGAIASGNQVMKDSSARDDIARKLDIICFEMEAAGLMDVLPCLPIRGICDYADSHKSKEWQKYAAATAAAYAKELIEILPANNKTMESAPVANSPLQDALPHRRRQLLESFKFQQIDSRKIDIKPAHAKTCHWFPKHPQYLEWLDAQKHAQHHGLLWIRGKPGSGKSTMMKFIYRKTKAKSHPPAIKASFFFHARGESLQKSIVGMYRSLLLQLLEGYPDLQEVLDDTDLVPRGQNGCPPLNTLKELFHNAVSNIGQRLFTCFVDALDECDEQQVMEMIHSFEDLAEHCAAKGVRFQMCFSSRHYPYIRTRHGIEITLEHQQGHSEDMDNYTQHNLRIREAALVQELRSQMLEKAAGVFLWVVLVVDILNKEDQQGGLALRKRLAEIPSGLSELFKDILKRNQVNMDALLLCILWILCAKRPLRPEEYYHALWSGLVLKDLVDPDMPDACSTGRVRSYVITSSKGLAEITTAKSSTVQFIHESVRDFLIKDRGLQELWPDLGFDWQTSGHERLKQCCSAYINRELARASLYFDLENRSKRYPFLEYASQHILYHSNAAAQEIPQGEFLSQTSVQDWITTINLFERFRVRRYSPTASLTYILADKGLSLLIRTWLQNNPKIDIRGERYEYPLFAALANGHKEAFAALLDSTSSICEGVDAIEGFGSKTGFVLYKDQTPMTWAAQEGRIDILMLLIQKGADIDEIDPHAYTPLMRASRAGHQAVVSFLIKEGATVETRFAHEAMSLARENGHTTTSKHLTEEAITLHARDVSEHTALSLASKNGHLATGRLLIDSGSQINPGAKGSKTKSALIEASMGDHVEVARLLLESGANTETRDEDDNTPLMIASIRGYLTLARLLMEQGADLNAQDVHGESILHHTVYTWPWLPVEPNRGTITKLLLDNGATVDVRDFQSETPLLCACRYGRQEASRLLIEYGADVNARDIEGNTPLHRVAGRSLSAFPPLELARLLIDKGADIHARDGEGSTALHMAVTSLSHQMAKLLIERGAHVDDRNHRGYTPKIIVESLGLRVDHPLVMVIGRL